MNYLNSCQGDKESEDLVGAFEDSEDAEVPHDLLDPTVAHVAHTAQDLNGLVCAVPRRLLHRQQTRVSEISIIPSHGRAYTFSIVCPAHFDSAKLCPFAPHSLDILNVLIIKYYGVGRYNKNRTSRLGVPSAILNDRSPCPGLPSCRLRPHSGRPGRGDVH